VIARSRRSLCASRGRSGSLEAWSRAWVSIAGPSAPIILFFGFLFVSNFMVSCSTHRPTMSDLMISYTGLKTVIKNNMPGGVLTESSNGRTLTSGYFLPNDLDNEPAESSRERAFAVVTILGTGRPYSLDIRAYREGKREKEFKSLGPDQELARAVANRIRRALADRREDRNLLDDFRAF
jgi:hypothetical protein